MSEDREPPDGPPDDGVVEGEQPGGKPSLRERLGQQDRRRAGGPTFWQWLRRTARLWGFLAFIVLILAIFRSVILPFMLALLVAYVLAPLVRSLSNLSLGGRRLPRFAWIIVTYAVLLGLMALFVTYLVPRLSVNIKQIAEAAPRLIQRARTEYVPRVDAWVQENFGQPPRVSPKDTKQKQPPKSRVRVKRLASGELELDLSNVQLEVAQDRDGRWIVQPPRTEEAAGRSKLAVGPQLDTLLSRSESQVNKLLGLGQRFVKGILSAITTFILVLMISAFLLVDTERILGWFRNLMPRDYHADFDKVIKRIDKGLSGAIRGQFIICCINGLLTGVGLLIFQVDYPLLLALLAGVMSLIPIFGSILSSIPIVLVALASGDGGEISVIKGVLILLWIIAIHLLEANLLNPKIMGTAAKIHPVIVIFAVVAGERTYGPMGALLGVPLVSAVQAVFTYLRGKMRAEAEAGEGNSDDPGQQPARAKG